MSPSEPEAGERRGGWWRGRTGVTILGFALVGAFFVLREHWGHVLGFLPYLLLLAWPLIHLFMYGGHGHHHGGAPRRNEPG